MAKILLVEDDHALTQVLIAWLENARYEVDLSEDGVDGLERLRNNRYDAVILDWGLPGMSGLEVLRTYRNERGTAPVLLLTGRSGDDEKEAALDGGADDYLTKPFSTKELLARVRALLRRPQVLLKDVLIVGDLSLDTVHHKVLRAGKPVPLMPREFALLEFLMRHPGSVFSAETLLQRVWPADSEVTSDALRTYIMRLRQKIEKDGLPSMIDTIPRVGYSLRAPSP